MHIHSTDYEGWIMSKIHFHRPSLSSGNMFTSSCYVIISMGFVFVSLGESVTPSDHCIMSLRCYYVIAR